MHIVAQALQRRAIADRQDMADNVYMAKLAEQAERYEEMVEYMKAVAQASQSDLTLEERNLLSVGSLRSSIITVVLFLLVITRTELSSHYILDALLLNSR